ncbi:chemotaxis protein CheW [Paraburkholderia ginsengiterrae]|uniref:Chemotaxis protein CheW n=1 Tax=Paraburkholderia ginsengiterrae TaxID=1462993 RepID=A0A1A9NBP9_9BURK|nr:chemotaxis protein CheW [Paraburkholderia ginsengiterrae]OAJ60577.1 chemotaxis protein CheW [Paraburkholderia ginsengiterrae]OAJ64131.1 chemotaxis protein CheW [Paraburkholderia ginsengiterrae]
MLFILFTLDSERYVIDATQVERLMPLTPQSPPKTIPGAPAWVAGVLDHEGMPLPVIDLPALALGRPAAQLMSTRVVLVRYPHAGATRLLALLLEGATRTIRLNEDAFHDAGIDMPHARYLGPVASEAGGLVQWIRVEHLLPDDVKTLLFPEAHA